jgi:hypothetical protein
MLDEKWLVGPTSQLLLISNRRMMTMLIDFIRIYMYLKMLNYSGLISINFVSLAFSNRYLSFTKVRFDIWSI